MSVSINLTAIVGSLREGSTNRAVFNAATTLVPAGVTLSEIDVRDVPFFDGDLEAQGDPAAVAALQQGVGSSQGLIVFTPEYNRSVPAVTKNAIDWLSRLPGDSVLSAKPVGIIASTPGQHDAAGVRAHLATSIGANTDRLYELSLGLGSIGQKLSDGELTDAKTRSQLAGWLLGYVGYVTDGGDVTDVGDAD